MMRQIDRLIVKELLGPWIFGVGLFSSLLVAVTYLGRLTGFLSSGIPVMLVLKITALYLPAMVVNTFAMAMLLSGLLAFGRLSSDSEIVALRASGAGLMRIIAPVILFSFCVALLTFGFNEIVVPQASRASIQIENQIAKIKAPGSGMPFTGNDIEDHVLKFAIAARNQDPARLQLQGVAITAYGSDGMPTAIMTAKVVQSAGLTKFNQWLIPEGAHITYLHEPREDVDVKGQAWPDGMPKMDISFVDLITPKDDKFDTTSMGELAEKINLHRLKGDKSLSEMANYEYGYWNKIAIPLAALIFGTLGSVLGIRNHRTGTATGFALAITIIFGYFMLVNFMAVWAQGGAIPPWVASFTPVFIGLVASGVIMWRRNA